MRGRQPRLVGRTAELDVIDGLVASVSAGDGAALALVGEAGIGKSTLLRALAERARDAGMLVLEGRCAEHEREVPYGPVVDALDDIAAEMGGARLDSLGDERRRHLGAVLPSARSAPAAAEAGSAGTSARFHRHRALSSLLELLAGEQPVALVIDDLHWADDATLEFVDHLLRRPPRRPVLLAMALRGVPGMHATIDSLRTAGHARQVPVGPVDDEAGRELLADVADPSERRRLLRMAGGNPLFLTTLARAAASGSGLDRLPPVLVAAVQRETAALPRDCRTLLDGAAVIGDPFDPELAAEAAGIAPAQAPALLDRLSDAGLVRPGDSARRFHFRHPLVRRAAYDAAPAGWRLGAHERAAAALARRGAAVGARAFHVAQSARPGDAGAIEVLVAAGDDARATSPAAAASWYESAERLVPAHEVQSLVTLKHRRAMALVTAGRVLDSARLLAELDAEGHVPEGVAPALLVEQLAGMEAQSGLTSSAIRRLQSALRRPELEPMESVRLMLALALYSLPDLDVAMPPLEHARKLLGRGDSVDHLLLDAVGSLTAMHGGPVDQDALDALIGRLDSTSDDVLTRRHLPMYIANTAILFGERYGDGFRLLRRARDLVEASSQGHWLVTELNLGAVAWLSTGDLAAARGALEVVEELAALGSQPGSLGDAYAMHAWLLALESRTVEARSRAAQARAVFAGTNDEHLLARVTRAFLALVDADAEPAEAARALSHALGTAHELTPVSMAAHFLRPHLACLLALGADEQARRLVAGVGERVRDANLPLAHGRILLAEGELASAAGRSDRAEALLSSGIEAVQDVGGALDVIEGRIALAALLASGGDEERARGELRMAADAAERLGAFALRARAARGLRRLGHRIAPVPSPTPATPDLTHAARASATLGLAGLTPREQEIVALVAAGHSNKQVGAALHLSAKTIEGGLSQIYGKLGVRSRVELAALVAGASGDE